MTPWCKITAGIPIHDTGKASEHLFFLCVSHHITSRDILFYIQRPKYQKKPPPPKYRPPPPQPPKQTYTPNNVAVPNNPAPTYVQPSAPKPEDAAWPQPQQDMPKITSLDVQCEKNLMKVSIAFDKPFKGIIFSKGYYSDVNCVHLPAGVGNSNTQFDIAINSCGTAGNTGNH